MSDIVERLRTTIMNPLQVSAEGDDPRPYPNCAEAAKEIERLRAHLKEADELLEIAYYAHQKMGLEACGDHGLSHEVRMFAMHFSDAETPKHPQHTILSGDGRYWRFRLRDMEAK